MSREEVRTDQGKKKPSNRTQWKNAFNIYKWDWWLQWQWQWLGNEGQCSVFSIPSILISYGEWLFCVDWLFGWLVGSICGLCLEQFTYDTVCDAISWPSAYKFCTCE